MRRSTTWTACCECDHASDALRPLTLCGGRIHRPGKEDFHSLKRTSTQRYLPLSRTFGRTRASEHRYEVHGGRPPICIDRPGETGSFWNEARVCCRLGLRLCQSLVCPEKQDLFIHVLRPRETRHCNGMHIGLSGLLSSCRIVNRDLPGPSLGRVASACPEYLIQHLDASWKPTGRL